MPHVSAVRAWRFAQELVGLGHRVVLLCAPLPGGISRASVGSEHDWRQPCVLPCAAAFDAAPNHALGLRPFRRIRTALRMLRDGGSAREWLRAAVDTGTRLPPVCRPDVVWCTFGQMEAVFAARRIARRLRRPWVLDVKDNWELYVPRGLRMLMVWRTRGFAVATANSQFTQHKARKWQGVDAALIYSGVEECFFAPFVPPSFDEFSLNLVGGIYFPEPFREFVTGVAAWYRTLPEVQRAHVRLRYIGSQGTLVQETFEAQLPELTVHLPGYVSPVEMAKWCQRAALNAYIAHPGGFHHKLPELLACGRPVLACPAENEESIALAAPALGQLSLAPTAADVTQILEALSAQHFYGGAPSTVFPQAHLARFRWSAQARLLEKILARVSAADVSIPMMSE